MSRDPIYVGHIRECIRRIQDDTRGGREAFFSNRTLQDAVLRNLQILTESSQRLSAELKAYAPGIPWRNIAGFRNRLVHDYFNIDLAIVWAIVSEDLPRLKAAVDRLGPGEPPAAGPRPGPTPADAPEQGS